MDSCRVCMTKRKNMFHIFNTDIVDRIQFCTGLQITYEDGLPAQICNICLDNLSIAHKFKTLCLLAEKTFRNTNTGIKEEFTFKDFSGDSNDFDNKNDEFDIKENFAESIEGIQGLDNGQVKPDLDPDLVRRSSRVKLKVKQESITEKEIPVRVRKKRGPYNKSEVPKRLRKFKFRKLYCEPCDLKFSSKEQSDEHKKDTHKGNESFVCEICGKVFVYRASHYTHVRSHLPPQYACEQCDYRTSHKHDLVKHVRIHTGLKLYQCEYCTASYYTSSNLTCHIRRYHERERRHPCHLCERSFYDRTKLNRHLDSHNDIKRFECDTCHACFTRRCYWKKHLQRQHNITVPRRDRVDRRPTGRWGDRYSAKEGRRCYVTMTSVKCV